LHGVTCDSQTPQTSPHLVAQALSSKVNTSRFRDSRHPATHSIISFVNSLFQAPLHDSSLYWALPRTSDAPHYTPVLAHHEDCINMGYLFYSIWLAVLVCATGMSLRSSSTWTLTNPSSPLLHPPTLVASPSHPRADLHTPTHFFSRRYRGWSVLLRLRSVWKCRSWRFATGTR
jgi:hypothetical protein